MQGINDANYNSQSSTNLNYEEDPDEIFTGPQYLDAVDIDNLDNDVPRDEGYDDDYETESALLTEGRDISTRVSDGIGSDYTHGKCQPRRG